MNEGFVNWNSLSKQEKTKLIKNAIKEMQIELSQIRIDGINFKEFAKRNIGFKWEDNDKLNYSDGLCENKKLNGFSISLNLKYCENSQNDSLGINAVCMLRHEMEHAFQYYIIDKSKSIFASDDLKRLAESFKITENKKVKVNIYDREQQCFKSVKGNLHINTMDRDEGYFYIKRLSTMFYVLNAAERNAFNASLREKLSYVEYSIDRLINDDRNYVQRWMNYFKGRYNCSHLNNSEIEQLIDKCFMITYYNQKPENDLEESIVYDLSLIAALNNGSISFEECEKLLDNSGYKDVILDGNIYATKEDSEVVPSYEYYSYKFMPEKFSDMTTQKQIKNTELAIFIAVEKSALLIPYLKDINTMKKYCVENIGDVLKIKNAEIGISNLFGAEFFNEIKNLNTLFPDVAMNESLFDSLIELMKYAPDEFVQINKNSENEEMNDDLSIHDSCIEMQDNDDIDLDGLWT